MLYTMSSKQKRPSTMCTYAD